MAMKLRMTVDMYGITTHARIDDIDLDLKTFERLVLLVFVSKYQCNLDSSNAKES